MFRLPSKRERTVLVASVGMSIDGASIISGSAIRYRSVKRILRLQSSSFRIDEKLRRTERMAINAELQTCSPRGIRVWIEVNADAEDRTPGECRQCPTRVVDMAHSLKARNQMALSLRQLTPLPRQWAKEMFESFNMRVKERRCWRCGDDCGLGRTRHASGEH